MNYIQRVDPVSHGQADDVEMLRRELADLVLEWAGRAVKDDPESPLGTALAQAVREAARDAVTEQHQALSRRDAEGIAEAIVRLRGGAADDAGSLSLPRKSLLALGVAALAVVALAFVIGLEVGRGPAPEAALVEPALTPSAAVAPLAPPTEPAALAPSAAQPTDRPRAVVETPAPAPAARSAAQPRRPAQPSGRPAAAAVGDTGGQPVTGARPVSAQPTSSEAVAPVTAP